MKKIIYGLALVLGLGLLASCNNVYQVESAVSAHSETNYYTVTGKVMTEGKSCDKDGKTTWSSEETYTLVDDPLHTSIYHATKLNDSNVSDEWRIDTLPVKDKRAVKSFNYDNGVKNAEPYYNETEDYLDNGKLCNTVSLWITLKEIDGKYYFTQNQKTYELDDEAFCDDGDEVTLKCSFDRWFDVKADGSYWYQTITVDLVFTKK